MQKTHIKQQITNVTDSSKGQKIIAALYLVTNHIADTDPIKHSIRATAILLCDLNCDQRAIGSKLSSLLNIALLAGILSEQNVTILIQEIVRYTSISNNQTTHILDGYFDTPHKGAHPTPKMSFISENMSLKKNDKSQKYGLIFENKNKRQNQILSFINERKSVGIKDIAQLFTDVSEKTIQRELGALVESGKITKRGSKRWSIYMTVS